MTKVIGLTGGIGSGKTTVANYIASLGIPVYIADDVGKKVMDFPEIKAAIKAYFGEAVFSDDEIDRKRLAAIVFNDKKKLSCLNEIIHPAVRNDFKNWLLNHQSVPVVFREAAILFESGSYKDCNAIVTVTAPLETRIERVISRDGVDREQVLNRIAHQWPQEKLVSMSDFIVENADFQNMALQVNEILKKLRNPQIID